MCGICGIYHYGESSKKWRSFLTSMVENIIHRGPDEDGFFYSTHTSLGVRRLKIIDLETGTQPISNEDNTVHIVFNGEIYRFKEIRKSLEEKGHKFKTKSDTEVVIHLYEEYDVDFLKHFDGMFAFALWDGRQERLIIVRDRFGIKPLFYTRELKTGLFAFCSELRPLLKMPGLSKELDLNAIDQFFSLSYILYPRSAFKNINKLSPGNYLLIEKAKIREIKYWDLPAITEQKSYKDILLELDQAISSAVKMMMRSDVPYGAFLSGGLDSGTIVYHMMQHSTKPVLTFSVRFDEKSFDEGEEARLIANHLGTNHQELWVKPQDIHDLPDIFSHFGEPFADPSLLPTFLLSRLARKKVTVVLTGDGGDEILGGYLTYVASRLTSFFGLLPEPVIKIMLFFANQLPVSMHDVSFDYKLKKFLSGCQLPAIEHHAAWKTIFPKSQRKLIYNRDFQEQINNSIDIPVFDQWRHLFQKKGFDSLTQYQHLDIKTFLIDNNLTKVDRMGMANSLEARIPFLDLNVVNAALNIPASDRIRFLTTKAPLRQIMKNRLPDSIVKMKKKGFRVPFSFWFQNSLKRFVKDTLSPNRIKATGILQHETVTNIIDTHMAGKQNLNRQLWSLICFINWYDTVGKKGHL